MGVKFFVKQMKIGVKGLGAAAVNGIFLAFGYPTPLQQMWTQMFLHKTIFTQFHSDKAKQTCWTLSISHRINCLSESDAETAISVRLMHFRRPFIGAIISLLECRAHLLSLYLYLFMWHFLIHMVPHKDFTKRDRRSEHKNMKAFKYRI